MKKEDSFLKENKRTEMIIKGLAALLFPLILCVVYCAIQGKTIGDVFLPAGEWNDELFYFKQVEGMVKFGFPRGYFGFNESYAEVMSFAAWSPVLVFPWVIWGVIFGWGFMSPVICNIVLMCLTTCAFVLITKISYRQMVLLGAGMIFFVPFDRYMLSGMPEIICFCMVILFTAIAYSCLINEKIAKIVILFVMASVMTLMRPYLLLFMFLPAFILIKKKKVLGGIITAVSFIVTLGLYAAIKKYFGAEYFTPLFSMNWLTDFLDYGPKQGFVNLCYRLFEMSKGFISHSKQGITDGLASGAFFVTFSVMMIVFAVQFVIDLVKIIKKSREKDSENKTSDKEEDESDSEKISGTPETVLYVNGNGETSKKAFNDTNKSYKEKKQYAIFVLEAHYVFAMFGMLAALLLMYKLTEGSKHLLTFIAAGVFVLALLNNKTYIKNIVIALCFVYFFMIKANSAYDYQVPFADETVTAKTIEWESAFSEEINVDKELGFDNVVIWNLYDKKDGKVEFMKWQRLYALPKGCGISCCNAEYVKDNLDSLKSKYIATLTDGEIDDLLKEKYELLYSDEEVTLYRLR